MPAPFPRLILALSCALALLLTTACSTLSTINMRTSSPGDTTEANQLIRAIELRNDALARQLIARGASVNVLGPADKSPLSVAARSGNLALVKLLIDKGADVDQSDGGLIGPTGAWALIWAAENGHQAVVNHLAAKGARIRGQQPMDYILLSKRPELYGLVLRYSKLPLDNFWIEPRQNAAAGSFINNAAALGWLDLVKEAVRRGADVDNLADPPGAYPHSDQRTPLMMAASFGHYEVAAFLLEKGAKVNGTSSRMDYTALLCAAERGHERVAQLLIQKGADVNHLSAGSYTEYHTSTAGTKLYIETKTTSYYMHSPLMIAVENRHGGMVRLLLAKGAKIDLTNNFNHSALTVARSDYLPDIARLLLAAGAKEDPLLTVIYDNDPVRLQALMTRGFTGNEKGAYDDGPLCSALRGRAFRSVEILMRNSRRLSRTDRLDAINGAGFYGDAAALRAMIAQKWDFPNKETEWAICNALERGHRAAVDVLAPMAPTLSSNSRRRIIVYAAGAGNLPLVRRLVEADTDVESEYGLSSPLIIAAARGHLDIVKYLIAKKADVNHAVDGDTALQRAASRGSADIAVLLIARGADVNAADQLNYTPLALAAKNGHARVVELLLAKKANPDIRVRRSIGPLVLDSGETALMLAAERGHDPVIKLLATRKNSLRLTDWLEEDALVKAVRFRRDRAAKILRDAGAR